MTEGKKCECCKKTDATLVLTGQTDASPPVGTLYCDYCATASAADFDRLDADEYPRCPRCGEPSDYCQGHGEIAEAVAAGRPLPLVELTADQVATLAGYASHGSAGDAMRIFADGFALAEEPTWRDEREDGTYPELVWKFRTWDGDRVESRDSGEGELAE